MSNLTFADRCKQSELCLPDATYRAMLTKLHGEMLQEIDCQTKGKTMTRQTLYALAAVFGATLAGIALGLVFIVIASIAYSLHYGAC